ncbi:MAG: hypothetical protein ACEPOZ_00340 [Marinifilaceae bacterium]|jgi:hypothetical protein
METIKEKSVKEKVGLSAPWYSLQRILAYSIGQSGQVIVSELNSESYEIQVTAAKSNTAKALAETLQLQQELGNITVNIVVKDLQGNTYVPNEKQNQSSYLVDALKEALVNNPLVFGVEEVNGEPTVCCTPTVIQFWNDDLSNPYGFTSFMADQAFQRVLKPIVKVYTLGKNIGNF